MHVYSFSSRASVLAMLCNAVKTAFTSLGFCAVFDEMAANRPPADIAVAFAFMAAFIAPEQSLQQSMHIVGMMCVVQRPTTRWVVH